MRDRDGKQTPHANDEVAQLRAQVKKLQEQLEAVNKRLSSHDGAQREAQPAERHRHSETDQSHGRDGERGFGEMHRPMGHGPMGHGLMERRDMERGSKSAWRGFHGREGFHGSFRGAEGFHGMFSRRGQQSPMSRFGPQSSRFRFGPFAQHRSQGFSRFQQHGRSFSQSQHGQFFEQHQQHSNFSPWMSRRQSFGQSGPAHQFGNRFSREQRSDQRFEGRAQHETSNARGHFGPQEQGRGGRRQGERFEPQSESRHRHSSADDRGHD